MKDRQGHYLHSEEALLQRALPSLVRLRSPPLKSKLGEK